MITNSQIKIIHTLKNALGLDDEVYSEILLNFGAASSKDLSKKDACNLIDSLESQATGSKMWKKTKSKFEELGNRSKMATPAQLRKIEAAWVEFLKIADGKEVKGSIARKSLRKLLQRVYHISDLRFLPKEKVSKVLKTIETMINQKLTAS